MNEFKHVKIKPGGATMLADNARHIEELDSAMEAALKKWTRARLAAIERLRFDFTSRDWKNTSVDGSTSSEVRNVVHRVSIADAFCTSLNDAYLQSCKDADSDFSAVVSRLGKAVTVEEITTTFEVPDYITMAQQHDFVFLEAEVGFRSRMRIVFSLSHAGLQN